MGWHIGMTEEEMREFAGMSCPISNAKENQAHNNNNDDDDDDDNSSRTMSDKQQDDEQAPTRTPEKPKRREKSAANNTTTACPLPPSSLPPPPPPDAQYIYHLCQKAKWDEAVRNNLPYFPPTYMKDGKFTRASVYKEDIVTVANQYYKDTPGKWIVLELDCKLLYSLGIPILAQEAPESTLEAPVKCLQVFGGISTSIPLVHRIYPLFRKNATGEFLKLMEPESPLTAMPTTKGTVGNTKPGPSPEQPQKRQSLFGRLKRG